MICRHPDPKVQAAIEVEADRVAANWPPLTQQQRDDLAFIFAPINAAPKSPVKADKG
jgi:hypothetical protein